MKGLNLKLRIGHKLLIGFMICIIFSGIIGAVSLINIYKTQKDTVEFNIAADIEKEVLECRRQEKNILLFGPHEKAAMEGEEEESYLDKLNTNLAILKELVEMGEKIAEEEEEEEEEFRSILKEIKDYELSLKKIATSYKKEWGVDETFRILGTHIEDLRKNARKVSGIAAKIKTIAQKRIEATERASINAIWITLVVAITFAGGASVFLSRGITKPLSILVNTTKVIAKGDLTQRVNIKSIDETGELAQSFNKMAEDLEQSQKEATQIYNSSPSGMRVVDRDFNIVSQNETMSRLSGIDKASAKGLKCYKQLKSALCATEDCILRQILKGKELVDVETEKIKANGEHFPCRVLASPFKDIAGNIKGIMEVFVDITELKRLAQKEKELAVAAAAAAADRKRAAELEVAYKKLRETQQQLIQSGKMAAIGQLSAGVSHELNQPLTGIKGFAQVAIMDLKEGSPLREDLLKILEQADRMDKIIQNVRFFARKSEFKMEELDINKPIEDSLALLSEQLRIHNVHLTKSLAKNLPKIKGDANQLQQVFLNLITNARDAIYSLNRPEGGQITVKTALSGDGNNIAIEFTDTGCGISKENLEHIFNPFYTTKSPDRGMGLGLSIVYRIMKDHKGKIEVEGEEGKGTTFRITLPVSRTAHSTQTEDPRHEKL